MEKKYGIRWSEFNKRGQLVNKEKWFATDKARTKFIERREDTGNVYEITAYSDPKQ